MRGVNEIVYEVIGVIGREYEGEWSRCMRGSD